MATASLSQQENLSYSEKRMLKHLCEEDFMAYTRYFFKKLDGNKFILNNHHKILAKVLQDVYEGKITRLIINMPPGYTKTEMAVVNWISWCLARVKDAKFIHTSYSDALALLNSTKVKDVINTEEYQEFWPMKMRRDTNSKSAWYNEDGGGMYAVASGGSITGFRAGRMRRGFSGALIIDDPLKPDDAYSEVMRNKVNNRATNTFESRLAHLGVPIIVIMQRLHEDDLSGFLLKGGTGEKWHHLMLQFDIKKDFTYPKEFTHGVPIKHNMPSGPLWKYKHTEKDIVRMRTADPYTTASQYDQSPSPLGGGIFKDTWWATYSLPPRQFEYRFITGDTAQKTAERNDYSVFQHWGYLSGKIYLLDQVRGKWDADDLKKTFINFVLKCQGNNAQTYGRLRDAHIEDKSSGTGLIQQMKKECTIPIEAIQRNKDKVTRAMDCVPYIKAGYVVIPEQSEWILDYKSEFSKFTPMMTHKHDDQIDPTLDAIDIALAEKQSLGGTW